MSPLLPWLLDKAVKASEILLMVTDERRQGVRQWRLIVALCIFGFMLHIVWACGWLSYFGIEGFAQAKELKGIQQKLDVAANDAGRIQARLLEKSIIDVRIQQCQATVKRFYSEQLRELTDEYYKTNNREYQLPTCAELN